MKNGWIKIVGITALVIFLGVGVSFAGGYGCNYGPPHGPAYGHYRGWDHHPHGAYFAPGYYHHPPVAHYPVVAAPRFYPAPPPVYPSPGFFFGMSAPGVTFGIGVGN